WSISQSKPQLLWSPKSRDVFCRSPHRKSSPTSGSSPDPAPATVERSSAGSSLEPLEKHSSGLASDPRGGRFENRLSPLPVTRFRPGGRWPHGNPHFEG